MPKYQWSSAFELSVPEIDSDHMVMLQLVNIITDAVRIGDKQLIRRNTDRLMAFTLLHFSREEQLLESWEYGETDAHRQYHAKMYEKAVDSFAKLDAAQSDEALASLCDEPIAFLIEDVIRGDVNLKSFLANRGLTIHKNDTTPDS